MTSPQIHRKRIQPTQAPLRLMVVLLPLLVAASFFYLVPEQAQHRVERLLTMLQIQGQRLGILSHEPIGGPTGQALATPRTQTGPATGPLRRLAANPRYFTDGSGKAIYLTGSHTWSNLQDTGQGSPPPVFDYAGYLDFLASQHHNFFRLYIQEQARWGGWTSIDDFYFAPHPYPRTGPGTALDGGPRFDVSQFNQAYFDRMRQRIIEAGKRGIYVSVMLFNGWSIEDKGLSGNNPWQAHPLNVANNINGIDGDLNDDGQGREIHTLAIPAVTALQEEYVRKVIDTVNDLDNVLYEISNESDSGATEWQYHLINLIKAYEAAKPKQHPVGMTVAWPGGNNEELLTSPADWISPNGDLNNPPVSTGAKVIIADTDHLCGICGDRTWVWKSFTRGENPIFMDVWDCSPWWYPGDCNRAAWPSLRQNLGYAAEYAHRINLAAMTPQPALASTGYSLAHAAVQAAEYLVYLPTGGEVTVDLSATPGELQVEWFNPESGVATAGSPITGGASRSFTAPVGGDAVLYLFQPKAPEPTFQLFVPLVGDGTVSVEPPGPYTAGQAVTLTALPAAGWHFAGWRGDFSGPSNPLSVTIQATTTITATFAQFPAPTEQYILTLQIVGRGSITVTPVGPYEPGQVLTLTAVPAADWIFVTWGGDLISTTNPTLLAMQGNRVVTATFQSAAPPPPPTYTVHTNVVGNGTLTVEPSGPYTAGQPITVTAYPAADWRFAGWQGEQAGQENPRHRTITANMVITATFVPITMTEPLALVVAIQGGGGVALYPTGPYSTGQSIRLTAQPDDGWHFVGWRGALIGLQNPVTFTIQADTALTATFGALTDTDPYSVAVQLVGQGVVLAEPAGPYHAGQPISLTAQPAPGWHFVGWRGDLLSPNNPLTLTMTASLHLTARFATEPLYLPFVQRVASRSSPWPLAAWAKTWLTILTTKQALPLEDLALAQR
jgi:hypothetical protein